MFYNVAEQIATNFLSRRGISAARTGAHLEPISAFAKKMVAVRDSSLGAAPRRSHQEEASARDQDEMGARRKPGGKGAPPLARAMRLPLVRRAGRVGE